MSSSLEQPYSPRANSFAAATQGLRTTARWILTATAGVGGALVAGIQLTNLGSLGLSHWLQLLAAGVGLIIALTSVGYMIFGTSQILTDEWTMLAQIGDQQFRDMLRDNSGSRREKAARASLTKIFDELENFRDELFGGQADSVEDLYGKLVEANEAVRRDPTSQAAAQVVQLRDAVDNVILYANYQRTREAFKELRPNLARAAAIAVAGVLLFAYAASPPKATPATPSIQVKNTNTYTPPATTSRAEEDGGRH